MSRLKQSIMRDSKLCDQDQCFNEVRKLKNKSKQNLPKLKVGTKTYESEEVPDGFFDSISSLKTLDTDALQSSPSYSSFCEEYKNILKICSKNPRVPNISLHETRKILKTLRSSVNDYFSITAAHYQYSGEAGVEHLNFVMNAAITDLNNLSLEELCTVWACVLYKGHNKDRYCNKSYRTISTCPLVSKAIDCYISELYSTKWHAHTAETQFQRPASSHELAALTLTEAINFSLSCEAKLIFVLYLDASSAFDLVLRRLLVTNLYDLGITDQGLLLIDERIKSRVTICEWDKTLMGPIYDECGVEQGGVNSSEYYKVYNNGQLNLAQASQLGITIGPVTISSIGQADDVALVSQDIHALQGLLDLSLYFCKKYHITLNSVKTKLQVFSNSKLRDEAYYSQVISQLKMNDKLVSFSEEAEHVGIVRSIHGNLAHIQSRFSAHKKQLHAILPVGLARAHRANTASVLRAHQTYCIPVLFSGAAALTLKTAEVNIMDQYLKDTLSNLQKLMPRTPASVVYFLGGQLPATALLHIRQLTIFGMVCHQKNSILHKASEHQLVTSKHSNGSWIMQIRELCLQYSLPSPLSLLQLPPPKTKYKRLVKSHIIDFWELKLRADAASLDSLLYFNPNFMSLLRPHPIWTTCGSNPFEVNKAITQARMLSGRYITDQLARHWTQNKAGKCLLPGCTQPNIGSLEHVLLECSALNSTRQKMVSLCFNVGNEYLPVKNIIEEALSTKDYKHLMQFLLDCSSLPAVVTLQQVCGSECFYPLFYATRTWCYSIHRKRMDLLGLFQYR